MTSVSFHLEERSGDSPEHPSLILHIRGPRPGQFTIASRDPHTIALTLAHVLLSELSTWTRTQAVRRVPRQTPIDLSDIFED